jgi:hypothetical protein
MWMGETGSRSSSEQLRGRSAVLNTITLATQKQI